MQSARRVPRDDRQLDLSSFNAWRFPTDEAADTIRSNGRETLAPVPAGNGGRTGGQGPTPCDAPGGRGTDRGGIGFLAPALYPAGLDTTAGPRPSLGDGPEEVHLPHSGALTNQQRADSDESLVTETSVAEPDPLRNHRNYCITEADRLGAGSLK